VKVDLGESLFDIIGVSVKVERFAVAHIVQLAICAFPIIDAIEEVIDLFEVSFEEVSIIFAEGLVTDFEVLFHWSILPFWIGLVKYYLLIASWWMLSTFCA